MKAAVYKRYGSAEVVNISEIATPKPSKGEILVRVSAAGVTTADWRLRQAAFPGLVMTVVARLMFGVFRPRKQVLGSDFAGIVAGVGDGVTEFTPGDRVFGFSSSGAHAENLTMKADGAVVKPPATLSDTEAAALPFGAVCALEFLGRIAPVAPGERVLIAGASGGVGVYAVQMAKARGAEVTGVASAAREDLVRSLGADHFIDYQAQSPREMVGTYDLIFDPAGVLSYPDISHLLADGGRFVPLNYDVTDVRRLWSARRNGHKMILSVNGDSKEALERLVCMIGDGTMRPVIDKVYAFDAIRAAYTHVESRRRKGSVILDLTSERGLGAVA